MVFARLVAICGVSIGVAGCATRPLPQDVTPYDTYEIVQKVRCETRDAIKSYAIAQVSRFDRALAAELRNGTKTFADANRMRGKFPPEAQELFERYDDAEITYEFTFDITEKNNVSGGVDLLKTFTRGPLKIGLTAGNDRERQNTRNLRVFDSFEKLLTQVEDSQCVGADVGPNWTYPITGTLGLSELIKTFLDLNQSGNLTALKGGPAAPAVSDNIQFTTKVSSSVKPVLQLMPIGRELNFVGANLTADASREDKHQVIVVLTLPPEQQPIVVKTVTAPQIRRAVNRSRQRNLALEELDRQRDIADRGILKRDLRIIRQFVE